MKLSILIVNWNSKELLRQCLNTVNAFCAESNPQVIVVDGASFDGCAEMLQADFPNVDFVQGTKNLGFGYSNNLGFEKVHGDTLLLLNPDTELKAGFLQLLNFFEALPQAGIIGPRLLNSDGTIQKACVQSLPTPLNQALGSDLMYKLFPKSKLWGIHDAFTSSAPVPVEAISGACMLMPAEVFRRVGGFDPDYFMYGEDMDFCAKVRKLGLKIYHVPNVHVVHHGGGSSRGEFSAQSTLFLRQSIYRFIRVHKGMFSAISYRVLMLVSAIARMLFLLPCLVCSASSRKQEVHGSLRKWISIFRWSTGLQQPRQLASA